MVTALDKRLCPVGLGVDQEGPSAHGVSGQRPLFSYNIHSTSSRLLYLPNYTVFTINVMYSLEAR